MSTPIRIIRPASREANDLLEPRIDELSQRGWEVRFEEMSIDRNWPYTSSNLRERLEQLEEALGEDDVDYIWCARGGYGASDLLASLKWDELEALSPKLIIGFSDISALHCAFYAKLGWRGLHAPMPATVLWRKDPTHTDIDTVLEGLETKHWNVSLKLDDQRHYLPKDQLTATGKLFGGCFSVLTNLIGTPYFPKSLRDHIVFFEDTGENPGRLARQLNQWIHAGVLDGVKALVLGSFRNCAEPGKEEPYIYRMFADRTKLPTYVTEVFGHTSPNMPLMIGAEATVRPEELTWTCDWSKRPQRSV